jgi:quercetin dioxygenase-like cupin family protein
LQDTTDPERESTMTVLQEVRSPLISDGAHAMTVLISHPPGAPGYPPHRLPGGPGFGYMIDGEMMFELEGEAPRVLRAGDAFWGAGGDVIHYQDANNRADIPCSFVLTLFRVPGQPMLEWVTEEELEERKALRVNVPRSTVSHADTTAASTRSGAGAATTSHESGYERAHQWRAATRGLVLLGATAMAAADRPQSQGGSISITLTGKALSNDLLLADTGTIELRSLGGHAGARIHPMRVVPMRLDMLSDLPAIGVSGRGMTEPTQLRLVVELTAHNPLTETTSVMTCEYDSVILDAQTPFALLDFELQHGDLRQHTPTH